MSKKIDITKTENLIKIVNNDFKEIKVGYEGREIEEIRKVGDRWTDSKGVMWEQREGYKSKVTKLDDIRNEINKYDKCPKEVCDVNQYNETRLDKKYKNIMGMCKKCSIAFENKLRTEKKWEEYEQNKIKQNVISYIKDKESELDDMIRAMDDFKTIRENGKIDRWTNVDPEQVKKDITDDFYKFKFELMKQYNIIDEDIM